MKTAHFTHRAVLASGIAAAMLAWFAGAPAVAGHGYAINEHPLRGDFPTANSSQSDAVTRAPGAAVSAITIPPRQAGEPVHWLRGDFPTAAESRSQAVQRAAVADDIELKAALKVPGSTTLRLEQLTVEPGAMIDSASMKTAFICELVQGELESVIDGVSVTRSNGDVWTCPMQDTLHTNSGTKHAVLRVIHLVP